MLVRVTLTRAFEMDEKRVLTEPGFEPPHPDEAEQAKRDWLVESFWELCGFERDQDHLDGSYVKQVGEDVETEYEWPESLRV